MQNVAPQRSRSWGRPPARGDEQPPGDYPAVMVEGHDEAAILDAPVE